MPMLTTRLYAAFPASEYGGNIAGVVYDDQGLNAQKMQGIAMELGAPTTGFVRKRSQNIFDVRFFSTRGEMAMCGHVTVGIFVSLFDDGLIDYTQNIFRQATPAGEILIDLSEESGGPFISMKQIPPTFDLFNVEEAEIARLLGIHPNIIQTVGSASTALRHLFVRLPDEESLAAIKPDDESLQAFSISKGIDTIGVWCQQDTGTSVTKVRVRDLCHGVGDPEEAASGTTNGALASLLWRDGVSIPDENGIVSVKAEQGFEILRPSQISTQQKVSSSTVEEVQVGGSALRRLEGQFHL